ncbi:MAG: hypothetical protein V1918_09115 [Planctomycetota bacterium]
MTTRNKDFTFIELLTVIAVLATLAGILLPLLAQAAEEAKQVTCSGNLKEIGAGVLLYEADWDGVIPYNGRGKTPDDNNWGLWLWEDRVALALGVTPWNRQKTDFGTVFDCPDANPRLETSNSPRLRTRSPCPHPYRSGGPPSFGRDRLRPRSSAYYAPFQRIRNLSLPPVLLFAFASGPKEWKLAVPSSGGRGSKPSAPGR